MRHPAIVAALLAVLPLAFVVLFICNSLRYGLQTALLVVRTDFRDIPAATRHVFDSAVEALRPIGASARYFLVSQVLTRLFAVFALLLVPPFTVWIIVETFREERPFRGLGSFIVDILRTVVDGQVDRIVP